jgi:hypothetical protein
MGVPFVKVETEATVNAERRFKDFHGKRKCNPLFSLPMPLPVLFPSRPEKNNCARGMEKRGTPVLPISRPRRQSNGQFRKWFREPAIARLDGTLLSQVAARLKAYATCIKDLCKHPIKPELRSFRAHSSNGETRSFWIIIQIVINVLTTYAYIQSAQSPRRINHLCKTDKRALRMMCSQNWNRSIARNQRKDYRYERASLFERNDYQ